MSLTVLMNAEKFLPQLLQPNHKDKLAIALYGKSANEAINQLCQSLTESIPIRPYPEGQTTQKLITQINAWLLEM